MKKEKRERERERGKEGGCKKRSESEAAKPRSEGARREVTVEKKGGCVIRQ